MGKLAKLIVVIAIIAVAGYALMQFANTSGTDEQASSDQPDEGLRVEEKYGFTTETVGS
jgi:hypothetical protein